MHPLRRDAWYEKRTVQVLGQRDYNDYQRLNNPLKGDSYSRYRKYSSYCNEIQAQLGSRMQALISSLQTRVDLIRTAFPEALAVKLVAPAPALLDDSGLDEEADKAQEETGVHVYRPDDTEFSPMDTLTVNNWPDILATFVAISSLETEEPLDLYNLRKISFEDLDRVFYDMNVLTYHMDEETKTLYLVLKGLEYEDMISKYELDAEKQAQLAELMQPEFQVVFASLTGDPSFAEETPLSEDQRSIIENLPTDLGALREQVVLTGCSLAGKLSYFWGGKYNQVGWNTDWGVPRTVTSKGSKTTGRVRPYGLDCSGFVAWTFINAAQDAAVLELLGCGTATQWGHCTSLGWDEGQPGDLVFTTRPSSAAINHVGIVVSKDEEGNYTVVHCSSKLNGVVLGDAWTSGFRYIRRPLLYGGKEG